MAFQRVQLVLLAQLVLPERLVLLVGRAVLLVRLVLPVIPVPLVLKPPKERVALPVQLAPQVLLLLPVR